MLKEKINVMLIEDDIALGSSITEILSLSNFNVNWLVDGLKALDFLKYNTTDIIISDLMMPLMDGEELYKNIKNDEKFKTIPFIIITANFDDKIRFKQLESGVNDFILKPFKSSELILKIKNLLTFKHNIEKKFRPDPFSKVTIKLSEKDFLETINEYILRNLKSKIKLEDLSNYLFISESTLDKKIRRLARKNTTQYIREFKLDYALRLIDLGERNIQFLVNETGFNSFSYFSSSFKSYFGISTRIYISHLNEKKW